MSITIRVPELGTDRARLSVWFVRPGEPVYEGDRLAELVIPGATVDVPAPATGTIRERLVIAGDTVMSGEVLGTVEADEPPLGD